MELAPAQQQLPYADLIERDPKDPETMICNVCRILGEKTFTFKLQAGKPQDTTNIKRHFHTSKHLPVLRALEVAEEEAKEAEERGKKKSRARQSLKKAQAKVVGKKTAEFIATSFSPIRIVENPELHELLNALGVDEDGRALLPTRKALSNTYIPAVAKDGKEKLRHELEVVDSAALQLDKWTSSVKRKGYVAICISYFWEGERESALLGMVELSAKALRDEQASTTAKALADIAREKMVEFGCLEKVGVMVSDAPNLMPKIARELNLQWVPCVAHRLHLVISKAFNKLRRKVKGQRDDAMDDLSISDDGAEVAAQPAMVDEDGEGGGSVQVQEDIQEEMQEERREGLLEDLTGLSDDDEGDDESDEDDGSVLHVVDRLSGMVNYFRKSTKAGRKLEEATATINEKADSRVPTQVLGANVTRWTSLFWSMDRAVEMHHAAKNQGFQSPFEVAFAGLAKGRSKKARTIRSKALSEEEWAVLFELVGVGPRKLRSLRTLNTTMLKFQDDDVDLGMVLSEVKKLRDLVHEECARLENEELPMDEDTIFAESSVVHTLKVFHDSLHVGLWQMLSYMLGQDVLAVASLLHPHAERFVDLAPIPEQGRTRLGKTWSDAKDTVVELAAQVYLQKRAKAGIVLDEDADEDSEYEYYSDAPPAKRGKGLSYADRLWERRAHVEAGPSSDEGQSRSGSRQTAGSVSNLHGMALRSALRKSLEARLAAADHERFSRSCTNPSEFVNNLLDLGSNPVEVAVSRVLKRYLVAPVSTATPERVFSCASDVIRRKRGRLGASRIDELLFIVDESRRLRVRKERERRKRKRKRKRKR